MTSFIKNIEGEKKLIELFEKEHLKVKINLINEYPKLEEFRKICTENIAKILEKIEPDCTWLYMYPDKDFFEFLEKVIGPYNYHTKFVYLCMMQHKDYWLDNPSKSLNQIDQYLQDNVYVKRNFVRHLINEGFITEMLKREKIKEKLDILSKIISDLTSHFNVELAEYYEKCLNEIEDIVQILGNNGHWLYKYPDKDFFDVLKKWLGPYNDKTKVIYYALITNKDEYLNNPTKSDEELNEYLLNSTGSNNTPDIPTDT